MKKVFLCFLVVSLLTGLSAKMTAKARFTNPAITIISGETPLGGLSKIMAENKKTYSKDDLEVLSTVMTIENGHASKKCLLLTGSVVLNRVADKRFPNSIREVIFDGYNSPGPQQYATVTVRGVKNLNVKVPKKIRALAAFLLMYAPLCPKDVLYQSMDSSLGSKIFKKIGREYFAYY